ncbi:hypothetical protein [Lunatibacter salilacus]|uniref:hypothetical protein n=1 Tax=Lunatibacter salilacus TaxID=2483804 RepID=UPI00131B5EA4|nr:hypothetical protein [Lunatibacter salilacus]
MARFFWGLHLVFKPWQPPGYSAYLLFLLATMIFGQLAAQVNVLGKPGYIMTPNARWEQENQLALSFSYVPQAYAINHFMGAYHTENIYGVGVGLTDFMEVYLNITRVRARASDIGVGDRHLGFRFRLLAEEKHGVSAVLIVSAPIGTNQHLNHDALIVEKTAELSSTLRLRATLGYALPVIFVIPTKEGNRSLSLLLKSKKQENIRYLSGVFGGFSLDWNEKVGLSMEHDGHSVNAGVFVRPLPWLLLQGHTFEAKELGFSFSLSFPLSVPPKEMRADER